MLGLNHLVTQTGTVRDEDFQFLFLFSSHPRSTICRRSSDGPFLLPDGPWEPCAPTPARVPGLAALAGGFSSMLHALGLLFQPAGVVTFPGNAFATVQFKNPSGNMVEEVTVWVTAITVPSYCCKCCSSQSIDSASRWLVGSSSRSTSGFCNNRRQRATRRRSPPERCSTAGLRADNGGRPWRVPACCPDSRHRCVNDVLQLGLAGKACPSCPGPHNIRASPTSD